MLLLLATFGAAVLAASSHFVSFFLGLEILSISLYALNGQLWHVLRYYKDGSGPGSELFALQVAAIIARFTARHLRCVAGRLGGEPDVVTGVPSTRVEGRPGRHPLQTAIRRAGALAPRYEPLLARGPGQVDHKLADDDAFTVSRRLMWRRGRLRSHG